ncbi:MAG: DEAD/DEAH box helicase [Bacteroidales bacterium]|nr:DEAD/DEAH box helicase [Bacteroidales bacterium]MDD3910909.1 DEAD/DEAH box helicase [Bacteroidales bacterium]MDD4420712.1 DEAD/DEAH box helicase [Bacteroidales bacterium]
MTFKELKITEPVLKALSDKEYITPTPIQEQAIPAGVEGRDILGIAQTGTGKTAAFAIPIIEQLMKKEKNPEKENNPSLSKNNKRHIKALILTPTRELAIQIEESFSDYGKYSGLKHTVIFGGVKQGQQVKRLNQGVDILTATPGRLLDLIGQGFVKLNSVEHFVLDEADRMLDMGFIHDIRRIIPMLPRQKQTMLFSATMPEEINKISGDLLHNPVKAEVAHSASVVEAIEQDLFFVEKPQKIDLLVKVLNEQSEDRVLVFSRTKHGADKIARALNKCKIECEAIHGNKSQNARQTALKNFKSGKTRIIVATDIAARGLDIQDLGLVINYDLPDVAETYVHRIGRTGRAGNSGLAFTFCSSEEYPMIKDIQKITGKKLRRVS